MKKCKMSLVFLFCLLMSFLCTIPVFARTASPRLSTSSIKAVPGGTYVVALGNVPSSDRNKVQWSVSNRSTLSLLTPNERVVENGASYDSKYAYVGFKTLKAGKATVTAKYKGKSYRCTVTVSKVKVSVKASSGVKSISNVKAGDVHTLYVSALDGSKARIIVTGLPSSCKALYRSNKGTFIYSSGNFRVNTSSDEDINIYVKDSSRARVNRSGYQFCNAVISWEEALNPTYQKLERAGYNKNSKIERDVLKYINAYRRKHGLKNLKELSYLSHAAGYTMYAHPNTKAWMDAGDPCWEQMGTIVELYARKNMLQEGNYIPLTGNLSAKKIAEYYINAKEHDMGYNNLLRLNYVGIYVDKVRGTFIYLGDFYNSGN